MAKENVLDLNVGGIKCDNCDYRDMEVKFEDYRDYIGKPCPICGEPLLTEADYKLIVKIIKATGFVNRVARLFGIKRADKPLVKATLEMDGSGTISGFDIDDFREGDK